MPEALPLQPGDPRRLGSFEITGRLGVGEQGAVFLGRDPAGGPVAVKVMHVRLSGEPVARSRFVDAFSSARRVSGFCTAAILAAEVEDDRPYVVSEWVDGPSLQQLVDEEGPRGGAVVERLAVGIAVALAAVHRAGALHHNLKPGNVLLGRDGPRLSDFGTAPALEALNVGVTGNPTDDPAYRSPEQLNGEGVGPASDVFSWASTILFAAKGSPPFGDDSPSEVIQRIGHDEADLSEVPESLRAIMTDALAKDPAERPDPKGLLQRLLDESNPLSGRMPPSMVAEGRALAFGTVAEQPAPPAPRPGPPPPPSGPQQPSGPQPPFGPPSPAGPPPAGPPPAGPPNAGPPPAGPPPAGRPFGPPPVGPPPVGSQPLAGGPPPPGPPGPMPPGGPMGAPPPPPGAAPPQGALAAPSLPLLGKLSRMRRPKAEPKPAPPVADLDPAAFEETTTLNALPSDDAEEHDNGTQTARFEPVGPDPTATFDAVDMEEPRNSTEPHLIPGLGSANETGERRKPPLASLGPLTSLARMRRPSNHVLGVALSLFIGVGVGIAIIVLVLWPQLKSDDDSPSGGSNGSNRPVTTIPAAFSGTWKGTLVNTARNASFPVEISFETGKTTGRAFYPREKCTGTLALTRGTESALKMSLAIAQPCTAGVVEITRQPDGTLQYAWNKPGTDLAYGGRLNQG